jgi:hypothetical protein
MEAAAWAALPWAKTLDAGDWQAYRCFYQGQKIDKSSPGYERLLYAAEALTNYIENVVSQLPSMDEKLAEAWRRFIVDAYRRSPAVQDHLRENESWYDPALITLLKKRGVWAA